MQTKQTFITQIETYGVDFPENKNISRCIDLLNKYSDNRVFYRDHFDDGHFTGSVIVVNNDKTKILLMHHKKYGTWQQFGGHTDGETNIRKVAIRELEEEAGIQEQYIALSENIFHFDIHDVPAIGNEPAHHHYDVTYLAIVSEDIIFSKQEAEVHDIAWFTIDDVIPQLGSGKFSSGFEYIFERLKK